MPGRIYAWDDPKSEDKDSNNGGTTGAHKNGKGKTKDGLHLGSINSRDMSKNDDGVVGNEKRRGIWERRGNKTTNKKRKSSDESSRPTQATRASTTERRKTLLCRCRKTNRNINSGDTRRICGNAH